MTRTYLYGAWAGLAILCAGLGYVPEPQGAMGILMTVFAVAFFIPPAVLVYRRDIRDLKRIRILSLVWLITALVLIVANILSVLAPEAIGTGLYALLVMLTVPMICGQSWAMSLFFWACLLMASHSLLKKK